MGTTRDGGSQQSMWVAASDLPRGGGHPFHVRVNKLLAEAGFDAFVEKLCAPFYAEMGRPRLAPGRYFRLLLVGYFEGLDSERAIAWRASDSLSVRSFLHLAPAAAPPDHSTISRTRRLLSMETHEAVFAWALQRLADAGLVRGKTVGIDATTLEARAAMRSIVRRDTGEGYTVFLTRLAAASGIETPTRAELARFDRSRREKKTSNAGWTHPQDPDARVTKMIGGGSVGVAVYDDRLEVTSSGTLHFGLTPAKLFAPHESLPWNPFIARTFYRRGIIEAWGRGTLTMAEAMASAGLPRPEIEDAGGCVTVRFRHAKATARRAVVVTGT